MILLETIDKLFLLELRTKERLEIPSEFVLALEKYISNYSYMIGRKPLNKMHEKWSERDRIRFNKIINQLELWGKIRSVK